MGALYALSQLGLALYMFLVGLEFRADTVSRRLPGALAVSGAGILAPLVLGSLLAVALLGDSRFFGAGVSAREAVLFMAAAMAVTAFPVLARILQERGLTRTSVGTLTLAAGSLDDVAAWTILALALAQTGAGSALHALAGGVCYAAVVLLVGRPLLARLA